jgi:sulfatase modifying factor 1
MTKASVVMAVVVLLCLGITAQADVFSLGPGLTNLETVRIGDPGNVGELSGSGAGGSGFDRVCGSVPYLYYVGKYEVTAAQYCDFLNRKATTDVYGLWNSEMWYNSYGCKIERSGASGNYTYRVAADWANRPVNYVSFWDACRFANWLNNGEGNGDTETGAYTLDGQNGNNGSWIQRNAIWKWAVASEDEWYKAAYYKGVGTNAGYWDYPMQSNIPTVPSNDITGPDGGNNANFYQSGDAIGSPYYRTNVGEFENSESHYGTFDQGGNVQEWTDTLLYEAMVSRGCRGGSFHYDTESSLRASSRNIGNDPNTEGRTIGFRVSAVPEPSGLIAFGMAIPALALAFWRRQCLVSKHS